MTQHTRAYTPIRMHDWSPEIRVTLPAEPWLSRPAPPSTPVAADAPAAEPIARETNHDRRAASIARYSAAMGTGWHTAAELGAALGVTAQGAGDTLRRMRKAGLVESRRDQTGHIGVVRWRWVGA
jgi:hypothetical protein